MTISNTHRHSHTHRHTHTGTQLGFLPSVLGPNHCDIYSLQPLELNVSRVSVWRRLHWIGITVFCKSAEHHHLCHGYTCAGLSRDGGGGTSPGAPGLLDLPRLQGETGVICWTNVADLCPGTWWKARLCEGTQRSICVVMKSLLSEWTVVATHMDLLATFSFLCLWVPEVEQKLLNVQCSSRPSKSNF